MPVCRECNHMAATVEMRRSPKQGEWLCRDKARCKQRRAAARANEIANQKGAKR